MRSSILGLAVLVVGGCSSIDLPDIGGLDEDFRNTRTDITDTPSVASAPVVPGDLRSAPEWDRAAKAVMAERDSFDDIAPAEPLPDLDAEVERLRAEVNAYKLDDPTPGN